MESRILALPDVQTTQKFGRILGESLPAKSVVLLKGDLGAGKTTLVQGLGKGLGIKEIILSPTFMLVNEYVGGRLPLYHFDLYRLQPPEVEKLYLDIYWHGEEITPGITAIEWSERLPYLPYDYIDIELSFSEDLQRQANINLVGTTNLDLPQIIKQCN